MQEKAIQKILIAIIIALVIILTSTHSLAGITPKDINGTDDVTIDLSFMDNVTDLVSTIGAFIAVGALMVIGIKYVTASIEEKANYKKSMMPYVIGCFILFGASIIVPAITDMLNDIGEDTETIGNNILGIIQIIGSLVSVGVLMILGIKYMVGSAEERASYKKTMLPYIIGVVLIFAAVNLTTVIYNLIDDTSTGSYTPPAGVTDADSFVSGKTKSEVYAEWQDAVEKRNAAYAEDPNGDEYNYWMQYANQLYEHYRWM